MSPTHSKAKLHPKDLLPVPHAYQRLWTEIAFSASLRHIQVCSKMKPKDKTKRCSMLLGPLWQSGGQQEWRLVPSRSFFVESLADLVTRASACLLKWVGFLLAMSAVWPAGLYFNSEAGVSSPWIPEQEESCSSSLYLFKRRHTFTLCLASLLLITVQCL